MWHRRDYRPRWLAVLGLVAPFMSGCGPDGDKTDKPGGTVKLEHAVVLPQSLPSGAQETFSVDYRFTGGGPQTGRKYAWVIAAADGRQKSEPVQLQSSGTLQLLNSGFAPGDGPFRCWLAEAPADGGEYTPICEPVAFRD